MNLTGLSENKVDAAETKEENKEIIVQAGAELADDELNDVSGGRFPKISKALMEELEKEKEAQPPEESKSFIQSLADLFAWIRTH